MQHGEMTESKLTRIIRPLAIVWLLVLFTVALIMNWLGFKTDSQYQETIFWALVVVLGFYFPGRDIVKSITARKSSK